MIMAGFDIGGANTDCSIIEVKDNKIVNTKSSFKYLPMWKEKDNLGKCLKELVKDEKFDAVSVSMTAELVDGYETKKEGVMDVATKVINTFKDVPVGFVTFNGIKDYDELKKNPLDAAAANWIGTTSLIKFIKDDCIFIDMGSTTTDIIPIINGKECAEGHTDLERLCTGELVYTGMLRTNVATIVNELPIHGYYATVSSELFAITADVHTILGNIKDYDYSCQTVDGNNKDKTSCMRRISRVVCADLETVTEKEIQKIAEYIYKSQIEQVKNGLLKVVNRTNIHTVITTGLGMNSVCYSAAKNMDLQVINMEDYFSIEDCVVAPAIGAAYMFSLQIKIN